MTPPPSRAAFNRADDVIEKAQDKGVVLTPAHRATLRMQIAYAVDYAVGSALQRVESALENVKRNRK